MSARERFDCLWLGYYVKSHAYDYCKEKGGTELSGIVRDFKKFTSSKIKEWIEIGRKSFTDEDEDNWWKPQWARFIEWKIKSGSYE